MAEENASGSNPPGHESAKLAPEVALPASPPRSDTSARQDTLVGQRLASYEILSRVARGGMGVVYRARHVYIDKIVAVKVLDPALAQRPDLIERFRTEAQSLARVEHENVVKVIDILEDKGVHFIVMDFAEGINLRNMVKETGPLTSVELLSVARQTAEALYAAHREGILHRDIKPENLIRNARGRCKLADFGLAGDLRLIAEGHEGPLNFGTPAYSAPEVLRRRVPDRRSDIFSYGATMYHLATGEPPFGHSGLQQIMLRQKQGAELLDGRREDLPVKLCKLIMDCLALEPAQRPDSFSEILERLPRRAHTRVAGATATATEPTDNLATASAPLPPEPAPAPNRAAGVGVLVLALAAAALVAFLVWQQFRSGPAAPNLANVAAPGNNGESLLPAPSNLATNGPPANGPGLTFLPEDEAYAAAELDSRTALSRADYVAAFAAFAAFLGKYPASRYIDQARQAQKDVQSRVQQLRQQEMRKAREASDEALKERRTADALAALARFPAELLKPLFEGEEIESAQLLETQRQVVIAAEAGDLARLFEQADSWRKTWREDAEGGEGVSETRRLRAAPMLLKERDLLEAFLPGRTQDTQDKVSKRLAGLRKQLETSHQNAMLAFNSWRQFVGGLRADWALQGVQLADAVAPLLANRDFEAARKRLDELTQKCTLARQALAAATKGEVGARVLERREVEDLLKRLRDDISLAEKCNLAMQGALRRNKLSGTSTDYRVHSGYDTDGKRSSKIDRYTGRVLGVTQTDFEIETDAGRVTLKLDLLTIDSVRALLKPSRNFDEQLSLIAWLVAQGKGDLAGVEEARIARLSDVPNDVLVRMRELVAAGRLAPAALRRLAYMAVIEGKMTTPADAALWPESSLESQLVVAQARASDATADSAAAYIALVRDVADPELVHLETLSRALAAADAPVNDLKLRLALEPWDARAHAQVARGNFRAGAVDQAKLQAQRALLIDPSCEEAWTLLKEIG